MINSLRNWKILRIYRGVLVLVFMTSCSALFNMTPVSALYGRDALHGYFTDVYKNYGTNDGCAGKLDCNGLGANNIEEFTSYYHNKLNSGDDKEMRTASFTILVMLGVDGPSTGGFDSGIDMARARYWEWDSLVRSYDSAGRINYSIDFTFQTNTFYNSGHDIVWYAKDVHTEPSVVFTLPDGSSVAIKRACANLVGDNWTLATLPWNITPTVSADRTTAAPGDTINWTHAIRNDGPVATTNTVTFHYQNRGDFGGGSGPDAYLGAGSGAGATASINSAHTVTQDAVGKNLCRATSAIPHAWNDGGWTESASWCVNVPYNFNINVSSTVDRATATPGDTITWTHKVWNVGPTKTNVDILYSRVDNAALGGSSGRGGDWVLSQPAGVGATSVKDSTHVVTQDDVGKSLCRVTSANPKSSSSSDAVVSDEACTYVPYNYSLTPRVTTNYDSSGVIEPNSTVTVTPSIANTGPTKSRDTQWQITQIIVKPAPAGKTPIAGINGESPCGTYFQAPNTCSTIQSGNSIFSDSGGVLSGTALSAQAATIGDLEVGTRVCFALSVQPYSSASAQWKWSHSPPKCLTVGKKPKVQVWGGDLSAGKLFVGATNVSSYVKTSTSIKQSGPTKYVFGSWIEYGIFATGQITGAGSGSAYAGTGLASTSFCKASLLSFTLFAGKTSCVSGDTIGYYKTIRSIPDVAASFPGGTALAPSGSGVVPVSSNTLVSTPTGGTFIGTYGGDIKLNPSNLAPGKSVILKIGGTVTIAGNQSYDPDNKGAKYTSAAQLPQLVIIANKIIIEDSVTNVDAWLIANGTDGSIVTCSSVPPLTSKVCDKQLTVNGPVMARKLFLWRTAGSGVDLASGDPAEIFNLRPDAYLWASLRATGNGRIQTVFTTELPPRL